MIIRSMTQIQLLVALLLLSLTMPAMAGKLYRFSGEGGVITISRNLPPSAAQGGYDILDGKSLQVIEHVEPALNPEEIAEKERLYLEYRQIEVAEQQAQQQLKQQEIDDKNLLLQYPTEQDLIDQRDSEVESSQLIIKSAEDNQDQLEQQLVTLQQQAADQELNGLDVNEELTQQLHVTQQEIESNDETINQLNNELAILTEKFSEDQIRLQQLLQEN